MPKSAPPPEPSLAALRSAVGRARGALLAAQRPEGYWCFELEGDAALPAEYVLFMHFVGAVDVPLQAKLAVYLRSRRSADGGWPLFAGGTFDLGCSVKAYFALKLAGDGEAAPHMAEARQAIRAHGGAARANAFTRLALALFGQLPWDAVPCLPVELLLQPGWSPFHPRRFSYWARTITIPFLVLYSRRARAANPTGVGVPELFVGALERPPERGSPVARFFLRVEAGARRLEPLSPPALRRRALGAAEAWLVERRNGTAGLGAIFPAMVNAHEAFGCLGYPAEHPLRAETRRAMDDLLVLGPESAYVQPCRSPVWDTALSCLALLEAAGGEASAEVLRALDWLAARQLGDEPGDWRDARPGLAGGGWPFQFQNPHYPDLDDTAAVAWALHAASPERYGPAVGRAAAWICGMQSRNGGFAAFDADNALGYLEKLPFADYGALLDPPSADVSARCATLLARALPSAANGALAACLGYLDREQEPEGCWFGRWGTNYVYGTWSVLTALEAAGVPREDPRLLRAAAWLKGSQNDDGGWGEGCETYGGKRGAGHPSTSFQTAWALLALLAAGEGGSPEAARGVEHLLATQGPDGTWADEAFTGPAFPGAVYLKYHGYGVYFPLWALARYVNERCARRRVAGGASRG